MESLIGISLTVQCVCVWESLKRKIMCLFVYKASEVLRCLWPSLYLFNFITAVLYVLSLTFYPSLFWMVFSFHSPNTFPLKLLSIALIPKPNTKHDRPTSWFDVNLQLSACSINTTRWRNTYSLKNNWKGFTQGLISDSDFIAVGPQVCNDVISVSYGCTSYSGFLFQSAHMWMSPWCPCICNITIHNNFK